MTNDLSALEPEQLKELLNSISTPQELKQLLEAPGVNDDLITEFAREAGSDAILDRLFTLMGGRFLPDKAAGKAGVVQWNVKTPDGGVKSYHVVIGDGKAESKPGPADSAKVTLTLSLPNMLRLAGGKLHGVTGVMTGKIKVSGDMMFAAAMQSWFDY